jgi:heat shock protein HslJ
MSRHLITLLLPLFAVLVQACHSTQAPIDTPSLEALRGHWLLLELRGVSIPAPEEPSSPLGLELDINGAITGYGGVNRFSGQLDQEMLAIGTFEVGPLMSTRKAGTPEAMRLEQDFTQVLEGATTCVIRGPQMRLGQDGTTTAVFEYGR